MKRLLSIAAAVFVGVYGSCAAAEDLCQIARDAMKVAQELRGLREKRQTPCVIQDKEAVRGFLLHSIKTKLPPRKFENEERVFKALGMIPESFVYEKGMVDYYMSQLGGYYDPERKRFAMAGWMPAILQTTIAVHELTHALQDQYFSLEGLIDNKMDNSDALLARSALAEGDASAVMYDYARRQAGQPLLKDEKSVSGIMLQNVLGASVMASGSVPKSMQMMLLFPYNSGLRFVHALLRKGGYERVNSAFRQPPRSTEEILHPEKYFISAPDFTSLADADVRRDGIDPDLKHVYGDTLGEFAISALLSMVHSVAREVADGAAGWAGDRLGLFESEDRSRWAVVWELRWDTEADAREFADLYRRARASTPELSVVQGERAVRVVALSASRG